MLADECHKGLRIGPSGIRVGVPIVGLGDLYMLVIILTCLFVFVKDFNSEVFENFGEGGRGLKKFFNFGFLLT
jgi:hypothetical protein